MITPLRRLVPVGLTVLLSVSLVACGKDEPAPAPTTTAASASPTPSPTESGPVAPVLPEAAKVNDEAGAKAFVTYWFAAVTYAMQTGDTKPIDRVAHGECETCANLNSAIASIYGAGQSNVGGGWLPERVALTSSSEGRNYGFRVVVNQPEQSVVGNDGATLSSDPQENITFVVGVLWDAESFWMYGVQAVN